MLNGLGNQAETRPPFQTSTTRSASEPALSQIFLSYSSTSRLKVRTVRVRHLLWSKMSFPNLGPHQWSRSEGWDLTGTVPDLQQVCQLRRFLWAGDDNQDISNQRPGKFHMAATTNVNKCARTCIGTPVTVRRSILRAVFGHNINSFATCFHARCQKIPQLLLLDKFGDSCIVSFGPPLRCFWSMAALQPQGCIKTARRCPDGPVNFGLLYIRFGFWYLFNYQAKGIKSLTKDNGLLPLTAIMDHGYKWARFVQWWRKILQNFFLKDLQVLRLTSSSMKPV